MLAFWQRSQRLAVQPSMAGRDAPEYGLGGPGGYSPGAGSRLGRVLKVVATPARPCRSMVRTGRRPRLSSLRWVRPSGHASAIEAEATSEHRVDVAQQHAGNDDPGDPWARHFQDAVIRRAVTRHASPRPEGTISAARSVNPRSADRTRQPAQYLPKSCRASHMAKTLPGGTSA